MSNGRRNEDDPYRKLGATHPDLHPDATATRDFYSKYNQLRERIGLENLRGGQKLLVMKLTIS